MMYIQPNSKLIRAHIREERAEYLATASSAAALICRMVKIALVVDLDDFGSPQSQIEYSR